MILLHSANLATFIQRDLLFGAVVRGGQRVVLRSRSGAQLVLRITQFEYTDPDTGAGVRSWDFAYCQNVTDLPLE